MKKKLMEEYIFIFFSYLTNTNRMYELFEIALSNLVNGEFFMEAFQEFYKYHKFVEKSEIQSLLNHKTTAYDYCIFLALQNSLKCLQIVLELGVNPNIIDEDGKLFTTHPQHLWCCGVSILLS